MHSKTLKSFDIRFTAAEKDVASSTVVMRNGEVWLPQYQWSMGEREDQLTWLVQLLHDIIIKTKLLQNIIIRKIINHSCYIDLQPRPIPDFRPTR